MAARRRFRCAALAGALAATGLVQLVAVPAAHAGRLGTVVEYPVPRSDDVVEPNHMVAGPDGNMWWVTRGFVNRITPGGVVSEFAIPGLVSDPAPYPDSQLADLTVGVDGNIWYVVDKNGGTLQKVGKMATSGSILAEYNLDNTIGEATSIAAGPDGNMWVLFHRASTGQPNVVKVTTAGALTYYSMHRFSLSNDLTAGPGGRLWWIDRNWPALNSFLPSDPVGSYQFIEGNNSYLSGTYSLAVGADGNLWNSLSGSFPGIGRTTPAGDFTNFALNSNYGPNTVSLGPDGNIWFPYQFNDQASVGRMKPDGSFETFPLPSKFPPNTMAAGPDGTLWYTRTTASGPVVGHIDPGQPSRYVVDDAPGFSNKNITTSGPGSTVGFVLRGPGNATVTDNSGLGLYDSGSLGPIQTFSHTYPAAGSYNYVDTLHPSHNGTVGVPPTSTHRQTFFQGGYTIQWATGPPPAGFVYDVQRKDPGGDWADYILNTTSQSSFERPFNVPGVFSYRARLKRSSDSLSTDYSPQVSVKYGMWGADFDGVGCGAGVCAGDDVAVWRPSNGTWYAITGNADSVVSGQWGTSGDVPVFGDYDGDGNNDLAVYRPSNGVWYINGTSAGASSDAWGVPFDIPVPGDYDGDGVTDKAVYRPSNGTWYVQTHAGPASATMWGNSTDIPVPADYDGDGKVDLAVFRPSTGEWYVKRSSDGVGYAFVLGTSGDVPVPADYDGDGKADIAVWRPSDGTFRISKSTGSPLVTTTVFFNAGDIPAPGDYDGDGITDPAVMRPGTNNVWYMRESQAGDKSRVWGVQNDVPIELLPSVNQKFYLPPPVAGAAQQKK